MFTYGVVHRLGDNWKQLAKGRALLELGSFTLRRSATGP